MRYSFALIGHVIGETPTRWGSCQIHGRSSIVSYVGGSLPSLPLADLEEIGRMRRVDRPCADLQPLSAGINLEGFQRSEIGDASLADLATQPDWIPHQALRFVVTSRLIWSHELAGSIMR